MKTLPLILALTGLIGWLNLGLAQPDPSANDEPVPPAVEPAEPAPPEAPSPPGPGEIDADVAAELAEAMRLAAEAAHAAENTVPAPEAGQPAAEPARPPSRPDPRSGARPPAGPRPAAPTEATAAGEATVPTATTGVPLTANGEPGLMLNFRGAPLELVLNYLSEAAGFIIVLETEVRGKLDVWSNQPLSKDEAVDLLNKVLAKNGYTALREGRTLTIVATADAKKRDIPVRSGSDPTGIPKGEAVVTQILPVRFVNAVQLSRDLAPLFPASATIAANEGGNALVVTDTLTSIRRIAEIVRALDTSISSVSAVRVFPLQFADAKALATVVRDLFASTDTASRGGNQAQQMFRGFRGGPPGMGGDAGGGGSSGSAGGGRVSTPRVVAVADERSNALVVSAPEEQMPIIEDLVKQVDANVDDVTELRVFRLKYSDPQETADLITELFPDPTSSQNNQNRGQVRFGGFGGRQQAGGDTSTRLQKQSRVLAVPDLRTQSVVVSAAHDLMEQIGQMVEQLDSDPAKKQKVFTFSVENTDPAAVEEILRGLFEGQNSRNRSSTSRSNTRQAGSQLNNRANSTMQNQGRNTSGFGGGNSGFGGGTGR